MTSFWTLALALCAASAPVWANSRIVGGSPTSIEKYPSVVQIDSFDPLLTRAWSQTCAASILTARSLLSGAQCFSGSFYHPSYRRARAGATYRNFGGELKYIEYSFNHPTYGTNYAEGDICVVRLLDPLVYNPVVQRTSIPEQDAQVPDLFPVTKVGWGYTSETGPFSDAIRDVGIFTVNNELCAQRYATLPSRRPVTENMICAGVLGIGGSGPCYGDAGGPLFFTNITVGVISWGEGCGNETFPAVNTAVARYTNWIIDHVV